jgi:hypothetical protein
VGKSFKVELEIMVGLHVPKEEGSVTKRSEHKVSIEHRVPTSNGQHSAV